MSGNNYSINNDLTYTEIILDSRCADGAFNSNVSKLNWPVFQVSGKRTLTNIAAMKVLEFYCPATWYNFNEYNNTFTLREAGPVDTTVTITPGNYNSSQMEDHLKTILDAASQVPQTFTVTYNQVTMKFTIVSSTSAFSLIFGTDIQSNDGSTNPRVLLGFNAATNSSSGTTLVAPNVALLSGPDNLFLSSRNFGHNTELYLPKGAVNLNGGNAGPQFACIPVNVQPGGTIFWNDPALWYWFNTENMNTLQEIDFYLTLGPTGNSATGDKPIDLNGASFKVKLGLMIRTFENNEYGTGTKRRRGY